MKDLTQSILLHMATITLIMLTPVDGLTIAMIIYYVSYLMLAVELVQYEVNNA